MILFQLLLAESLEMDFLFLGQWLDNLRVGLEWRVLVGVFERVQ